MILLLRLKIKPLNIMKKLFFFIALPLLLVSCKGVEQYKAGIDELAGNWDTTTKAITEFSGKVSSDLSNYTQTLAGMRLDDKVAAKLSTDQTSSLETAQKAVIDALGGYPPLQKKINEFVTTWTEKSGMLTTLKDGLAAGKIEGDVPAQISELGNLVTTANDNLSSWKESYTTIQGRVDTAMSSLTELMGSLASAK